MCECVNKRLGGGSEERIASIIEQMRELVMKGKECMYKIKTNTSNTPKRDF